MLISCLCLNERQLSAINSTPADPCSVTVTLLLLGSGLGLADVLGKESKS